MRLHWIVMLIVCGCRGAVVRPPDRNPEADAINAIVAARGTTESVRPGQFQPCDRSEECPTPGRPGECDVALHRCNTRCAADIDCPTAGNQPSRCEDGICSRVDINSNVRCTMRRVTQTTELPAVSAAQASGTVETAPSTAAALYPGAVLQASAISDGRYVELPIVRAPISLTTNLPTMGSSSAVMSAPSRAQYEMALANWVRTVASIPAAQISFSQQTVRSVEEVSVAVSASVGTERGTIQSAFDFARRSVRSRTVLRSTQAFFSVDAQPFSQAADAFSNRTFASAVDAVLQGSPVYVSRVTYGRESFVTFESELDSEEMGASVNLAIGAIDPSAVICACVDADNDGGCDNCTDTTPKNKICDVVVTNGTIVPSLPVMGAACAAYRQRELFAKTRISAYLIGSRVPLANITSAEQLTQFLNENARFDPASMGAPISYQLAYLSDNTPVSMSITGAHSEESCTQIGTEYLLRFVSMRMVNCDDGFADRTCEMYGNVTIDSTAYDANGQPVRLQQTMWSRAGNRFEAMDFRVGDRFPSAAPTTTSSIAQRQFSHIGALGRPLRVVAKLWEYDRYSADDPMDEVILEWTVAEQLRGTRIVTARGQDNGIELTFVLSPCTNGVCEALLP